MSKSLFWDVDVNNINWDKHSNFVINRVLSRGTLQDWTEIKKYYGLNTIKTTVLNMRYLDKLTLHFCSVVFDIPREDFRCYDMIQSTQELWNY